MSPAKRARPAPAPAIVPASIKLSFVCGADLSSRLIAWYGNGYGGFSHVDAVLPSGELLGARDDAIGDAPPGVQVRPDNYEKWIRRTIVTILCTQEQAVAWERWLRSQIGKPYDSGAIWGFIFGTPSHEQGHWICSACQTGALKQAGLLHPFSVPDSQVTPDALFLMSTAGIGGIAEDITPTRRAAA